MNLIMVRLAHLFDFFPLDLEKLAAVSSVFTLSEHSEKRENVRNEETAARIAPTHSIPLMP